MSGAGVKSRSFWRAMDLGVLVVVCVALTSCNPLGASAATGFPSTEAGSITVSITNPGVKIATVRVVGTEQKDNLDGGALVLTSCAKNQSISVWAPGYFIKSIPCDGSSPHEYQISLDAFNAGDDPNYVWVDADIRSSPAFNCASCHSNLSLGLNEYTTWNMDGHSRGFLVPYFWTTYIGTNINGALSQKTLWGLSPSGSRFRLPPDPNQPDYGPGYRLDYPNENGNCVFCHVPTAVRKIQQGANLASLINVIWGNRVNVETEGITCDVCHKAIDVFLDEQRLPYADHPGILSFSFVRPNSNIQFFVGPWSDLTTTDTAIKRTCAPIFSESQFCAPCHYAKFSGVEIYGSYKEWLDSPYSQPNQSYRSCQDCHMPSSQPMDRTAAVARRACSADNLSFRDFSHNMMNRDNTGDPILIQRAATVTVQANRESGRIKVNVNVVNTGAGHKFPTDSPLRHLILVVEAKDENDNLLTLAEGPTIPSWGGSHDQPEDYAGRPGVIYANILKDLDTSAVPAVDYWNPTVPAWGGSDTRLVPGKDALSQYFFVAPSHGEVRVTANLFYRYAFIDIVRRKGWPLKDILVNWDDAIVP